MPIARFVAPPSPIDAIGKALGVAASVYGIKHDVAANDLAEAQLAAVNRQSDDYKTANDPNSPLSKAAQQAQMTGLTAAINKGYIPKDAGSKMGATIGGAPAQGVEGQDGYVAATPGLSAFAIKQVLPDEGGYNAFIKGEQAAKAKEVGFNFRDEQMQDRQDYQAHQKNLAKLKSDPTMIKRLSQYQNLGNALSNFQNADVSNPQSFDHLQQAIRLSLGIGGGGVGEREHTYMNSLGLNGDRFMQFLSGDPVSISKNMPLAQHLKQLVGLESQNISNQMDKRIGALTAGNASVYKRNPEYKADLMDAISAAKDQYAAPAQSPAATTVGLPGMSSASAAGPSPDAGPHGPAVTQKGHTFMWNAQTKKYE